MDGCGLGGFDLGKCIGGYVSGWMPDWLAPLVPYWPWAAVILALGLAYRIAGVPGLAAASAAVGFIFGRRSVSTEDRYPNPDIPSRDTKSKKRKTLFK